MTKNREQVRHQMCVNHSHDCPECNAEVDNYSQPLECTNCNVIFYWIDCCEDGSEPWTDKDLAECEPFEPIKDKIERSV